MTTQEILDKTREIIALLDRREFSHREKSRAKEIADICNNFDTGSEEQRLGAKEALEAAIHALSAFNVNLIFGGETTMSLIDFANSHIDLYQRMTSDKFVSVFGENSPQFPLFPCSLAE